MADYTRTIGIVIGGYGLDTSKSGGTAWCYGDAPTGSTDYDWREVLTTPPQTVGIDVNPSTGQLAASSFDFELANTDNVAETLFYQERYTEYVLRQTRSATATAIAIDDADGNSVTTLGNSVVFIGDEAILLDVYDAGILSGGGYLATRGYYSTPAQPHAADDFVYTNPQFIRFRDMRLVLYDNDNDTESIVWRGFVEDLETNDIGTALTVRGIELFGVLQSATVNRGAPNLAIDNVTPSQYNYINRTVFAVGGSLSEGSSVFKSGEADPLVALQMGDELFGYAPYDISEDLLNNSTVGRFGDSWPFVFAEPGDDVEDYDAIYELFVLDYAEDAQYLNEDGTATASMTTDGVSATRELERPFHPLAIALSMILSTTSTTASQSDYDVLNAAWSLQVDSDFVDITSFETLIDRYPTYRVERLILGWDGEPVNVWETIREYCLRPFGFYFGTADDGKLNVSELPTNLGVGDFYNAQELSPIPQMLHYQASRQDAVDEVVGIIGATPWTDGNTLTIRGPQTANSNSVRNRLFAELRTTTYQVPFGEHATIADQAPRAFALLTARATQGAFATPRLIVRAKDPDIDSVTYDIGTVVAITDLEVEDAWIIDETGTRITLGGTKNLAAAGPIIGREYDVATQTYTLTLLLQGAATGELIQWRAPSAVVAAGSTTTVINVEQNAFHSASNDTSFFTAGDEVMVYSAAGVYALGAPAVVQSVTATSITVSPALSSAPTAGQIVRLTDYDGYSNSNVITGAGDNVYFYLSEDGDTLGAGGDDPHKYG